MDQSFCQSCGMPLNPSILGTNADGTKSSDYCTYCFKDGAFTGDFTMEEMVEFCSQYVDDFNKKCFDSFTHSSNAGIFLRMPSPTLLRPSNKH